MAAPSVAAAECPRRRPIVTLWNRRYKGAAGAENVRILQIAKHFAPDTGGIETVTRDISDVLAARGVRADVLCTATGRDYPEMSLPYRVHRSPRGLPMSRNKSISLPYMRAVRRLSADYDLAIVHMPNPVAVLAVLLGWRKPFVLLWHADIPQRAIRRLATPLDRLLIRRAAAVIGPTPIHLSGSAHAAALEPKGTIIGFPFGRERLPAPNGRSEAGQKAQAFRRGRKLILSIGRLVPYKGFGVLIDAASSFADDVCAVIVGEGPLRRELEDQIREQKLEDRVHLAGPVPDDGLADLLDMAHAVCMPSITAAEMYGMAQVEGLAFGKPLISTNIPNSGVPYVNKHGETGLVVEPGKAGLLAEAINRLASDAALHASLSEGAKRAFARDHDRQAIGAKYVALIEHVLGRA